MFEILAQVFMTELSLLEERFMCAWEYLGAFKASHVIATSQGWLAPAQQWGSGR
jgi:hypothetical protein